MTVQAAPASTPAGGPRADMIRWKRRSRLIAVLRKVLPTCIALLVFALEREPKIREIIER